jgi:hypothetical protein
LDLRALHNPVMMDQGSSILPQVTQRSPRIHIGR